MAQIRKIKTNVIGLVLLLFYSLAALTLNVMFPNHVITYLALGISIMAGLIQLKKQKIN